MESHIPSDESWMMSNSLLTRALLVSLVQSSYLSACQSESAVVRGERHSEAVQQ